MTTVAIATFDSEGAWLRARTRAIAHGHRIVGEWLPCASAALGSGEGEGGILGSVLAGGAIGGLGLFALECWSAIFAYPFDSGGRALLSWPAFIPAPVEFAALTAGIGGVIALFVKARLTRLSHPAFEWDEVAEASQSAFVLALGCDEGEDANAALAVLAEAGATHSRLIEP
ncbi:MAG: quinol:electron acceptor oxidoreductase subunit ActD [Sphingomonas sp.]